MKMGDKLAAIFESALRNSLEMHELLVGKCEKWLTKFTDGSPQKTLAVRRIRAFR